MTQELTELTSNPTVVATAEDRTNISRWQEYGHDRLYFNELGDDVYVDLQTGETHTGANVRFHIDEERGLIVAQRRAGWSGSYSYYLTVVSLDGSELETESVASSDGAERVDSKTDSEPSEPVAEVPPAVPYNSETAGVAQQMNAQRLFNTDGGES